MAISNGDIYSNKVLYRQSLGGGQDANGVKKNTKTLVVGEITALYVSTGIAVNNLGGDNCFGLTNLDFMRIEPVTIATAYSTAESLNYMNYDATNKKIFAIEDMGADNPATPSDADVVVFRFLAIGDDADAPELT